MNLLLLLLLLIASQFCHSFNQFSPVLVKVGSGEE